MLAERPSTAIWNGAIATSMDLILWRHADAEPGEPDLERPLTAKGVRQAERMAAWLDGRLPDGCRILVSPAERAQQTARALGRKYKTVPELGPGATAAAVLAAAGWPDAREPRLIVAHQPTRGATAALLLRAVMGHAQGRRLVAVRPGPRARCRGRAQGRHRARLRLARL
jgi:phosphohistidine phosphatase